MKRFKRYFIKLSIALIAFLSGSSLYLFLPPFSSSIKDIPRETPVAFVPEQRNKGKRCESGVTYTREKLNYADQEVIDLFCADVQQRLLQAAKDGDIASIRSFLAQGANPNAVGLDGNEFMGPLPAAAWADKREVVRLLLDNGGDVNDSYSCCMIRQSLLMMATEHHDVNGVRMLLARGADKNFSGFEGETAFDIAVSKDYDEIVQLLDEAGGLSLTRRAELRIARLPGMSLKKVHSAFIRWHLVDKPRHDMFK